MLTKEQVLEIRILKRAGLTNKEVSRQVNCHSNTITKYLNEEWRQMKGKSKLDPYKEYIKKRLEEYPKLTSVVLFKEIKEQGYTGGITTLRMYTYTIREKEIVQPIRYETKPGEQFQVDWGEGTTIIGGRKETVKFITIVLGYSRMLYAQVVPDEKLITLLNAHNKAFEYFGGYPNIGLYDNMKTVVKSLRKEKEYNAKFMDFADYYGFKVITHRPYNPRAKGKVERMVPFVRNNIIYGKSYSNLSELENSLYDWLHTANQRLQSELKETPLERFEREKEYLNKPTKFYPLRRVNTRIVREKGVIVYRERSYPVGIKYAGKTINLDHINNTIHIYDEDNLIDILPIKDQVEVRSLKEYQKLVSDTL
jgi:transposase